MLKCIHDHLVKAKRNSLATTMVKRVIRRDPTSDALSFLACDIRVCCLRGVKGVSAVLHEFAKFLCTCARVSPVFIFIERRYYRAVNAPVVYGYQLGPQPAAPIYASISNFLASPSALMYLTFPKIGLSFQGRSCLPKHHATPA